MIPEIILAVMFGSLTGWTGYRVHKHIVWKSRLHNIAGKIAKQEARFFADGKEIPFKLPEQKEEEKPFSMWDNMVDYSRNLMKKRGEKE